MVRATFNFLASTDVGSLALTCKRLINSSNDSYLVRAMKRQEHLIVETEMEERIKEEGNQAIIEVIDTGSGMAPEGLRRIFQVYYSTKKGGSGLGLPTTRRIIHEHHGSIRAESEVGKRTRFVIAVPLAEGI